VPETIWNNSNAGINMLPINAFSFMVQLRPLPSCSIKISSTPRRVSVRPLRGKQRTVAAWACKTTQVFP
jgi:hypothetical protein